jgi:flagellar hook-associated protein 2
MGLRLGGLSSGLDTEALIEAMMGLERRPLQLVQQQVKDLKSQKALFADLETKLTALRDAAAAIDNLGSTFSGPSLDEELLSYAATSSDETSVRATASGSASPGAVSVRVVSLAASARRVSGSFASDTVAIAAPGDTLDIAFGGGTISITAGASGASLTDLRSAINSDPNNDGSVRADVLFDGTGYRLVVRGSETGVANDVTLTTTIAGPSGVAFLDAAASQSAADASIEAFGLIVSRTSNTVTDLLPGVTLELRAVTAAPIDVSVEIDEEAVATKLDTFATAYNEVVDFITKQSQYDAATKKAGPLSGDGVLRSIQGQIQRTAVGNYSFGALGGLVDIGVGFDEEGHLSVDRADLTAALTADPTAVRQLLGGDGVNAGIAANLAQAIDAIVKSNKVADPNDPTHFIETALLPARSVAIDSRVDSFEQQITRLEARLKKREELLVAQFSRMEALISQLRQQGNSLAAISTFSNSNSNQG